MVSRLPVATALPRHFVHVKRCTNRDCIRWANTPQFRSCCGACVNSRVEGHTLQCTSRQRSAMAAILANQELLAQLIMQQTESQPSDRREAVAASQWEPELRHWRFWTNMLLLSVAWWFVLSDHKGVMAFWHCSFKAIKPSCWRCMCLSPRTYFDLPHGVEQLVVILFPQLKRSVLKLKNWGLNDMRMHDMSLLPIYMFI